MDEKTRKIIDEFIQAGDTRCLACDDDMDTEYCRCLEIQDRYKKALQALRELE